MPEWIVKYWVEWLFGLVIALLTAGYRHLSKRLQHERAAAAEKARRDEAEINALKNGMRSLLRSQIISKCERATNDQYCGAQLRDTINDLYASYHELGGNGTVTSIVQQTMALPVLPQGTSEHHKREETAE